MIRQIIYYWNKVLRKLRGKAIRKSKLGRHAKVGAGSLFLHSTMDRFSYCGYDCKIINCDIGAFCSIADNVVIGAAQHPLTWGSTSQVFYKGSGSGAIKFAEYERPHSKRTVIGNDVWIGECALIKGGVNIGNGAVVGMGSVVTHDVPPYCIVAGNPARLIRKRFDDETVKLYEEKKWWTRSEAEIRKAAARIREPIDFIGELK